MDQSIATTAITALFSSTVTLLGKELLDRWRENRQKTADAEFIALRVAVALEGFAGFCTYRHWHNEADMSRSRELDHRLPPLADYPSEAVGWKAFHKRSPDLARRVLAFPNEIGASEKRSEFEALQEGNAFGSADETIVAGVKASRLANEIRTAYRLGTFQVRHLEQLEAAYQEIESRDPFSKSFAEYSNSGLR